MRKLITAVAGLAGLVAGPALAAEMPLKAPPPPPPVWVWTGFYAGVNAGAHWGDDKITYRADPLGWETLTSQDMVGPEDGGPGGAAEIDRLSSVSLKPKGVMGGIQFGYNWQTDNFVWGVEADANEEAGQEFRSFTYINAIVINPGDVTTNSVTERFLGTVRGRLGVTGWGGTDDNPNKYLVYATGGFAVGTIRANDTFCAFGCPTFVVTGSDYAAATILRTRTGWTAGGGVEMRVGSTPLTVKVEYLFVDLGSFNDVIPSCVNCAVGSDITVNHKWTDNIVRAGINWHWGPIGTQ
jgi:outer membrane immunogenic protein